MFQVKCNLKDEGSFKTLKAAKMFAKNLSYTYDDMFTIRKEDDFSVSYFAQYGTLYRLTRTN